MDKPNLDDSIANAMCQLKSVEDRLIVEYSLNNPNISFLELKNGIGMHELELVERLSHINLLVYYDKFADNIYPSNICQLIYRGIFNELKKLRRKK